MSNGELAKRLGMNTNQVASYMTSLGLKRSEYLYPKRKECAENPNWTKDQDAYLIENYHRFDAEFIGRKINRTAAAVYKRAKVLDLKKNQRWV